MNDSQDNSQLPSSSEEPGKTPLPLDSTEATAKLQEFVKALFTLNHDLNNPLAGVVGYTELALSDPEALPDNVLDYLEKVQKSAEMMQKVIARCGEAKYHLQSEVDVSSLKPVE